MGKTQLLLTCSSRLVVDSSGKYEHPAFWTEHCHHGGLARDWEHWRILRRIGFGIEYCFCTQYRDFSQSMNTNQNLVLQFVSPWLSSSLNAIIAASLSPLSVYPRRVPCLYHPPRDAPLLYCPKRQAPLLSLMVQFQLTYFISTVRLDGNAPCPWTLLSLSASKVE